jgi:hypothetical protein
MPWPSIARARAHYPPRDLRRRKTTNAAKRAATEGAPGDRGVPRPGAIAQPYEGPLADREISALVLGSVSAASSSMSETPSPSLSTLAALSASSAGVSVFRSPVNPCASIEMPNGVSTLPEPVMPSM